MGREILDVMQEAPKKWSAELSIGSRSAPGFNESSADFKKLRSDRLNLVIDFSSPEAFRGAVRALKGTGRPFLSGTTGLTSADFKALKNLAKDSAVFWAPNTSLGVATLKKSLQSLRALADYDFQVEEIHHRHKKDAPSGTAKFLKAELDQVVGRPSPEALAIRGGGVPGLHRVWAIGPEEWLMFEHMAFQRKVFARGAVKIAEWLVKQKPGLYDMDAFLSERSK